MRTKNYKTLPYPTVVERSAEGVDYSRKLKKDRLVCILSNQEPEPGTIKKEMEQMETEQMEQALRNKNFFVGGLSDAAILHYYNKIFSK